MLGESFSTRDTVCRDTPAAAATSRTPGVRGPVRSTRTTVEAARRNAATEAP
jgi:hypothetical protein